MRLAIFPSDWDGPGSYRVLWPAEELRKHGWEVVIPKMRVVQQGENPDPGFTDRFLKTEMHVSPWLKADAYLFQMPHEQHYIGLAKLWKGCGRAVIAETDDDLLNLPESHPANWITDPANPKAKNHNRGLMRPTFEAASAVTCSSPSIAESFSELNPNTHVLPNYLWWPWWKDVEQQHEVDRGGRVRVGWMGRSFWRPEDVKIMGGIMRTVLERNPSVDFVAAGDPQVHDEMGIPEDRRVTLPPVHFRSRDSMQTSKLPALTASMDIGLVPLARNRFNEGKSYLKGMEYAACGIPCVATPTGPYRQWVDSDNGLLADSAADWVRSIETLLDRDTRVRMGRNARRKAERFTIQRNWQKWADVYLGEIMKARSLAHAA